MEMVVIPGGDNTKKGGGEVRIKTTKIKYDDTHRYTLKTKVKPRYRIIQSRAV